MVSVEIIPANKMRSLKRLGEEVLVMNTIVKANPQLRDMWNHANYMGFNSYYAATRDITKVDGELKIKVNPEMKILAEGIVKTIKNY